jgi:hypothetical protein
MSTAPCACVLWCILLRPTYSHALRYFFLSVLFKGTTRHCTPVFLVLQDFAHRCTGARRWLCPAHHLSWRRSLSRVISSGFVAKWYKHRATQKLLERGATRYVCVGCSKRVHCLKHSRVVCCGVGDVGAGRGFLESCAFSPFHASPLVTK